MTIQTKTTISSSAEQPSLSDAKISRIPKSTVDIQSAAQYLAGEDGKLSDKDLTVRNITAAIGQATKSNNIGAKQVLETIRTLYGGATKVPGGGMDNIATVNEFSEVVKDNIQFMTDLKLPKPVLMRINAVLKSHPEYSLAFGNELLPKDPTNIKALVLLEGAEMAIFGGKKGWQPIRP